MKDGIASNLNDLFSSDDFDLHKPKQLLNSLDLDGVASFIKSDKCKYKGLNLKINSVFLFSSLFF